MFGRLLELRNDVGLLSEEYDPLRGRLAGNFPLTASHVALAEAAVALDAASGDSGRAAACHQGEARPRPGMARPRPSVAGARGPGRSRPGGVRPSGDPAPGPSWPGPR